MRNCVKLTLKYHQVQLVKLINGETIAHQTTRKPSALFPLTVLLRTYLMLTISLL